MFVRPFDTKCSLHGNSNYFIQQGYQQSPIPPLSTRYDRKIEVGLTQTSSPVPLAVSYKQAYKFTAKWVVRATSCYYYYYYNEFFPPSVNGHIAIICYKYSLSTLSLHFHSPSIAWRHNLYYWAARSHSDPCWRYPQTVWTYQTDATTTYESLVPVNAAYIQSNTTSWKKCEYKVQKFHGDKMKKLANLHQPCAI